MAIMLDVCAVTKNWLEVAMAGHSSTDNRTMRHLLGIKYTCTDTCNQDFLFMAQQLLVTQGYMITLKHTTFSGSPLMGDLLDTETSA